MNYEAPSKISIIGKVSLPRNRSCSKTATTTTTTTTCMARTVNTWVVLELARKLREWDTPKIYRYIHLYYIKKKWWQKKERQFIMTTRMSLHTANNRECSQLRGNKCRQRKYLLRYASQKICFQKFVNTFYIFIS